MASILLSLSTFYYMPRLPENANLIGNYFGLGAQQGQSVAGGPLGGGQNQYGQAGPGSQQNQYGQAAAGFSAPGVSAMNLNS